MDALPQTCSHETVRKYIPRLESLFGEEATPKEWTASEVARKFKWSKSRIVNLCSSQKITGCRKQGLDKGRWIINKTGIEQLQKLFRKRKKKKQITSTA